MGSKKKYIQNLTLPAFIEEFTDFVTQFEEIKFSKWIESDAKNGVEIKVLDKFTVTFTGSGIYFQIEIKYQNTTLYSGTYAFNSISYQCYCRVSTNQNIVHFRFWEYSKGATLTNDMLFIITDNDEPIVGYVSSSNPSLVLSNLSDVTKGHTYSLPPRCQYFNSLEKDDVEIIMNKAVCENNVQVDTISNLYDCSTILLDNVYTSDNQKYYAIDSNTLIPV